jgi:hypothetical protein
MTGTPRVAAACTTVEPPKTDCSTTICPSDDVTSTASVSTPASSRTANRPAISLPSAVDGSSTAATSRDETNDASKPTTPAVTDDATLSSSAVKITEAP